MRLSVRKDAGIHGILLCALFLQVLCSNVNSFGKFNLINLLDHGHVHVICGLLCASKEASDDFLCSFAGLAMDNELCIPCTHTVYSNNVASEAKSDVKIKNYVQTMIVHCALMRYHFVTCLSSARDHCASV